jgi:hypothetical protein
MDFYGRQRYDYTAAARVCRYCGRMVVVAARALIKKGRRGVLFAAGSEPCVADQAISIQASAFTAAARRLLWRAALFL